MICALEIALLVCGIVLLAMGKVTFGTKVLKGGAVRFAGAILMLPLPISMLVGFVMGFSAGAKRQQFDTEENMVFLVVLEVGLLVASLVLAGLVLAFATDSEPRRDHRPRPRFLDEEDEPWQRPRQRPRDREDEEDLPVARPVLEASETGAPALPVVELVDDPGTEPVPVVQPLPREASGPSSTAPAAREAPRSPRSPQHTEPSESRSRAKVPAGSAGVLWPVLALLAFLLSVVLGVGLLLMWAQLKRTSASEETVEQVAQAEENRMAALARRLREDLEQAIQERELAALELDRLRQELARARQDPGELARLQAQMENKEKELFALKREIELKTADLTRQQEVADRQAKTLGDLRGELGTKTTEVAVLNREIERLKKGPGPASPETARLDPERLLYLHQVALADRALGGLDVVRAAAILDECKPALRSWEWHYLRRSLAGNALRTLDVPDVTHTRFSPDGKLVLTAGVQGGSVWDAQTGQELFGLTRESVQTAVFSPDGKTIRAVVRGQPRFWDVEKRAQTDTLGKTLTSPVLAVFTPDGKQAVVASTLTPAPKECRLWDLEARKEAGSWPIEKLAPDQIALSPDGKQIALTNFLPTGVEVLETATGKKVRGFLSCLGPAAFSPDGRQLAVIGLAGTVKLLELETGKEVGELKGHATGVIALAFSDDGKLLATGGKDRLIRITEIATGQEVRVLHGHTEPVASLAFSPDGASLVSSARARSGVPTRTGEVKLWTVHLVKRSLPIQKDGGNLLALAWSTDGKRIAISQRQVLSIADQATNTVQHTMPVQKLAPGLLAWSADNKRLLAIVTASVTPPQPSEMKVWDTETGKELLTVKNGPHRALKAAWSPDGSRFVTVGSDSTNPNAQTTREVVVWDAATGTRLRTIGDGEQFLEVVFDAGGTFYLLGQSGASRYVVAQKPNLEEPRVKLDLPKPGQALAVSRKGDRIAFASQLGPLHVLDWPSGKKVLVLPEKSATVTGLTFTPDGRRLVVAETDGTIRLWDLTTTREVYTLRATLGPVDSLAVSPDGFRLLGLQRVGALRALTASIWDASPLK
jgi:WD40 repeat protein